MLTLEHTVVDVRRAWRSLRQSPGFALVCVLTMALGIGATTAIFTLVHQVMLRSLPVASPDQLWRIGDVVRCCTYRGYTQSGEGRDHDFTLFSWEAYRLFRDDNPDFEELAAAQAGHTLMGVRRAGSLNGVEARRAQYVSGNFFRTFGLSPWRGRQLSDADDHEGAPPVAVLAFHYWQEAWAADPTVIGSTFQVNGRPITVVGVAPPGFFGARVSAIGAPDIWLPTAMEPYVAGATARLKHPNSHWLDLIGRVRPGTDPRALEARLQGHLHQWLASHVGDMVAQEKADWTKQTLRLTPGGGGVSDLQQRYRGALLLLLLAAFCVLAVACANVANLLLARGLKNRHDLAIRAALGASRGRLMRTALVESLLLGLVGGTAGVGMAWAGVRLLLPLAFEGESAGVRGVWIPLQASPSASVLLFAFGVSILTAVLAGAATAWMSAHADPMEAMRGVHGALGVGRSGSGAVRSQRALVVGQIAVSLVLLTLAALFAQSLRNLERQDFGFDSSGRFVASIDPKLSNYRAEELVPLFRRIEERLRGVPGVQAVGSGLYAPMSGSTWDANVWVYGRPEPGPRDDMRAALMRATPGFFDALGTTVLKGRAITESDNEEGRLVAVVSEAFARRFFGKEDPIGRRFGHGYQKYAGMFEVVGVVSDLRFVPEPYDDTAKPVFYLPHAQTSPFDEAEMNTGEAWSHFLTSLVIQAPGSAPDLQARVSRALAAVDPDLVMYDFQSYADVVSRHFSRQSLIARLTSLFGSLGLVLAAVGLYGVTAYNATRRTGEIGLRMALGASRGAIAGLVLRSALVHVATGFAIGGPMAIIVAHATTAQLAGVGPWEPVTIVVAIVLLGGVTLLAAAIPAGRAATLEPLRALQRAE